MRHEDLVQVAEALNTVREMLTIGAEDLCTVLEQAVRAHPAVSTHGERGGQEEEEEGGGVPCGPHRLPHRAAFLAFERAVALREGLSKEPKKAALAQGAALLRDLGQPPEDSDDLFSAGAPPLLLSAPRASPPRCAATPSAPLHFREGHLRDAVQAFLRQRARDSAHSRAELSATRLRCHQTEPRPCSPCCL